MAAVLSRRPAARRVLAALGWRALSSKASITLSETRLQEFMKAEIGHYALMTPRPLQLTQIINTSTADQVAELIHQQLPWHMATRIKHIETMPQWESVPEFVEVHGILAESFRNLRLVETGAGKDLAPLVDVIRDLRKRHKVVLPLLGAAVATLRAQHIIELPFSNQWLDTFLMARIGTEMLIVHFMKMYMQRDQPGSAWTGIVDSRCNPGEICREAAAHVRKDADYSSVPIHVTSHVCSSSKEDIEFSFLPHYLHMIVVELLKNSVAATIRQRSVAGGHGAPDETVRVTVAADERRVNIQISDKGGGIPISSSDTVWSYRLTTMEHHASDDPTSSFFDPSTDSLTSWLDPLSGLGIKRRLGMGLPLSKLTAEYLGGSLALKSLSGCGLDAYLSLRRIDVGSALAPGA